MHENTWFHKRVLKTLISRKNFVKLNKPWCNLLLQKTFATSHGIKSFAKNLCNKNFVNLTEKLICKGNFSTIVYLVNHIEIRLANICCCWSSSILRCISHYWNLKWWSTICRWKSNLDIPMSISLNNDTMF